MQQQTQQHYLLMDENTFVPQGEGAAINYVYTNVLVPCMKDDDEPGSGPTSFMYCIENDSPWGMDYDGESMNAFYITVDLASVFGDTIEDRKAYANRVLNDRVKRITDVLETVYKLKRGEFPAEDTAEGGGI